MTSLVLVDLFDEALRVNVRYIVCEITVAFGIHLLSELLDRIFTSFIVCYHLCIVFIKLRYQR